MIYDLKLYLVLSNVSMQIITKKKLMTQIYITISNKKYFPNNISHKFNIKKFKFIKITQQKNSNLYFDISSTSQKIYK